MWREGPLALEILHGAAAVTPLEAALDYIARGWNPAPVKYRAKKPLGED